MNGAVIAKPVGIRTSGLMLATKARGRQVSTIVNRDDYRIRRRDEKGCMDVFSKSLFARNIDVLLNVLHWCDCPSLMNLRQVSSVIYNLSMQPMEEWLSPLMCKVVIPCKRGELFEERSKKLEFALACTSICMQVDSKYLEDATVLGDEVRKANMSLAIKISNDNELKAFNKLFSSPDTSDNQKLISGKIKEVDLSNMSIEGGNVGEIEILLNFFAKQQRACQLRTLKLGCIRVALTLSKLLNLKVLKIGAIWASLILPELPRLKRLEFDDIWVALTLPEMPRLKRLQFNAIWVALTLPKFPRLMTLEFGDIRVVLKLPELPKLTMIEFGEVRVEQARKDLESLLSNIAEREKLAMSPVNELEAHNLQEMPLNYEGYWALIIFIAILYRYFSN